jgi:hypothetical protein|tara:strand:+ start:665 stop:808 length:144 start_codon:yes stop_codon:yes gene_type:complete
MDEEHQELLLSVLGWVLMLAGAGLVAWVVLSSINLLAFIAILWGLTR